jgi:hypothetical protein
VVVLVLVEVVVVTGGGGALTIVRVTRSSATPWLLR